MDINSFGHLWSLLSSLSLPHIADRLRKRVVRHHFKAAGRPRDQESGPVPDEAQQQQQQQQTQEEEKSEEEPNVAITQAEEEQEQEIQDIQALECNIEEDGPSDVFAQDLRVFFDECEKFIDQLVKNDAEAMRESLIGILAAQDGIEDDLAWIMVTQDNDGMVSVRNEISFLQRSRKWR